jgi:stage IV sporulation protein FB
MAEPTHGGGGEGARSDAGGPAMQGGALRVGTVFGIPIRVHFTFLLLLVWAGAVSAGTGSGFLDGALYILLVFGCVVLHELGHSAVARHYGVLTREITLYPIGGVARLDRMPTGMPEFVIALAGPSVNFVLAGMLTVGALASGIDPFDLVDAVLHRGPAIVPRLIGVNCALLLFNLIPAFPMDGGRMLRAGLAVFIGQERATAIAARVGQVFAVGFALLAVLIQPFQPFLLLIAFFIFLGAGQEAAYERGRSAMAGLTARDAMVTKFESVAPQDPIGRVADLLIATHQQDFPVIDAWGRIAGVLARSALLGALASGGRDVAVLEVMDREPRVVPPELPLEQVFRYLQGRPPAPVLVAGADGLVGMVTLDNLGELLEVSRSLRRG